MNQDTLRLNDRLQHAKEKFYKRRKYRKLFKNNPGMVFLVMTPTHGNMGDHAIAYAEASLLKNIGIPYTEITYTQLVQWYRNDFLDVMNGFPILMNGGGNLGTLWPDVEKLQREILRQNPRSKIAILPNTIFYEDSGWGREEFEKSRILYNGHRHLHLYAREKHSYEIMEKSYRNVKLIPDMVLSLPPYESQAQRRGCLLCLRGDCEKTRTDEQERILRSQVSELFGDAVRDTDMVENHGVSVAEREERLQAKFQEFASAELVITDRLHGMIFCAVTGTPCIVINSKSPKVRGCYQWIRHLDYIEFADSPEEIAQLYRSIPAGPHEYDNSHLQHYYQELAEDIKKLLR